MLLSISSAPRAAGVAVSVAALAAALAVPQLARAADSPGNNGTIKVHAPGTPLERNANEPKQVCDFYLAGFNYDRNQVVTYSFTVQGGADSGDAAGQGGSFTVGPDNGKPRGVGRTDVLEKSDHQLPDGRYKVTATTDDGSKTKVFEVNCPGGGNPEPTPTPTPTPTPPGIGGGGDDDDEVGGVDVPDGEVGGVDRPDDEDEGAPGVGGVDTGGGGTA